ncbi:hypothetical protein E1B28_001853 [Marasmius oreades]|uniref:Uncharacterized protein n=1 Tax=Marasmius oreades TaxID=181124 RepID=A0A9P7V4F7_9AGAR|nr:uncharacterized protein E1B28_001853 [Marasmius oreades]KAG7100069.1 hypothetical protein E1B28_001853 [Marasmius oreades]
MREESLERGIRKLKDFRNNLVPAGKIQRLKMPVSVKDTEAAVTYWRQVYLRRFVHCKLFGPFVEK